MDVLFIYRGFFLQILRATEVTLGSMFSSLPVSTIDPSPPTGEAPRLWLGLAGFDADGRGAISQMLTRSPDLPRWEMSRFAGADAWLLNGPRCRVGPDTTLDVSPGLPTDKSVKLDLSDVDRPVAFATPVPEELEPRWTFDVGSPPSVEAVLLHFDIWLRFERAQFELGAQVIRLGAALRHSVFHLMQHGNLLAVLDFRKGRAGLMPALHPEAVQCAEWHKRPAAAGDIPPGFVASSPAQLAWTYVRRSERDMLPQHYREQTIYFRRVPRVPLRLLGDTQLLLLRELSIQPSTLARLAERTETSREHLDHALACLYYAGSITTTSSKAARPHTTPASDSVRDSSAAASLHRAEIPPPDPEELTAPAALKNRKPRNG
jgi:hypothetical protein